jgi:hypothetical protein
MPGLSLPRDYREQLETTMRKHVLWRLTPTPAEEHYIRNAAQKEGRKLSDMTHKLLSEAILARQLAATEVQKLSRLAKVIRGEPVETTS